MFDPAGPRTDGSQLQVVIFQEPVQLRRIDGIGRGRKDLDGGEWELPRLLAGQGQVAPEHERPSASFFHQADRHGGLDHAIASGSGAGVLSRLVDYSTSTIAL